MLPRISHSIARAETGGCLQLANHASNAGSDYNYNNDNYLSSSKVPAEAVRSFVAGDQGFGWARLVTVQLQGLVSADESGQVSVTNPPDMTRFKTIVDKKITISRVPFTTSRDTPDADVYMDEFVWAMDRNPPGISTPIQHCQLSSVSTTNLTYRTRHTLKFRERRQSHRTTTSQRPSPSPRL